jgi:hypothetical protein
VHVLPDDARDGAAGHKAHDDDLFAFHINLGQSKSGTKAGCNLELSEYGCVAG